MRYGRSELLTKDIDRGKKVHLCTKVLTNITRAARTFASSSYSTEPASSSLFCIFVLFKCESLRKLAKMRLLLSTQRTTVLYKMRFFL